MRKSSAGATGGSTCLAQFSNLKQGDRIVWHSDVQAEYGIVKWIGILPDSHSQDITIGVEFVSTLYSVLNYVTRNEIHTFNTFICMYLHFCVISAEHKRNCI